MIYEILIRPSYDKKMTSDHLIWVESNLPTRSFEQWLRDKALLDGSGRAPLVRWSIVQTQHAAHYQLATQEDALCGRITELMSGATQLRDPSTMNRDNVALPSKALLAA